MKFYIRDILWATVVVGISLGWYLSEKQHKAKLSLLEEEVHKMLVSIAVRGFSRPAYPWEDNRIDGVLKLMEKANRSDIPKSNTSKEKWDPTWEMLDSFN